MKYVIEKNVPLVRLGHHTTKYPFAEMQVGDSFLAKCEKANAPTVTRAATQWGKRNGVKMVTRYDKENCGVRVWRVS